jgi:hypothetical protein
MSSVTFDLVPLDCPSCGAAVDAEGEDVAFYCVACRNGYLFDETGKVLVPLDVSFVAASDRRAERYLPFWRLAAEVTLLERKASGADPVGWISRFFTGEDNRRRKGVKGEGIFIVPAFRASLAATMRLTSEYTQAAPQLGEKLGERLVGACYPVADAHKLTHFTLIAAEVEQRDTLQRLSYDIEFGAASLLGVPFVRAGALWQDSLFGIAL